MKNKAKILSKLKLIFIILFCCINTFMCGCNSNLEPETENTVSAFNTFILSPPEPGLRNCDSSNVSVNVSNSVSHADSAIKVRISGYNTGNSDTIYVYTAFGLEKKINNNWEPVPYILDGNESIRYDDGSLWNYVFSSAGTPVDAELNLFVSFLSENLKSGEKYRVVVYFPDTVKYAEFTVE